MIDKNTFSGQAISDWEEKIKKDLKVNDLKSLSWVSNEGLSVSPVYHTPGKRYTPTPINKQLLIESRVFESDN